MTTNGDRLKASPGRGRIAVAACAALALAGACRSADRGAATTAGDPGAPARAPTPSASRPPTSTAPALASDARKITVSAKGQPWVEISARGETLTVATEGVSLVGQPRDDGKRKYAPAGGGPVLIEVKAQSSAEAEEMGELAVRFKLRSPDGKLLWKVKATTAKMTTKIKVASDEGDEQGGRQAFVVSAKHPGEVAVLAPDGMSIGQVRAAAGSTEVTGRDAAGAEVFRASTDLPPALLGVLLFQGMPLRERAIILAELAARTSTR